MTKLSTSATTSSTVRPILAVAALVTLLICVALAFVGQIQAVVLGAVQGLVEFLSISSSAHLILVPWFLGRQGGTADTLTFDVALHLGTLIAAVAYLWRDWRRLFATVPEWLGGLTAWGRPIAQAIECLLRSWPACSWPQVATH